MPFVIQNRTVVQVALQKGLVQVVRALYEISVELTLPEGATDIPFLLTKREAESLVLSGHHEVMLQVLQTASDQGYHAATYSAGLIHHANGDADDAADAFVAAADLGVAAAFIPAALYCLFHHHGRGGDADDESHPYFVQAVLYLQAMVELGDASAYYWLGHCVYHGKGIAKNPEIALSYYTMAAALGHFRADIEVAFLLAQSQLDAQVSRDLIESEVMPRMMPLMKAAGLTRMPVVMRAGTPTVSGVTAVRVHFRNDDGSFSTDYHNLRVPEQWLLLTAPAFKLGLTQFKVAHLLSGGPAPAILDDAMAFVQNPPGNMDTELEEFFWSEDCEEAMRDALMFIANAIAASPAVTGPV